MFQTALALFLSLTGTTTQDARNSHRKSTSHLNSHLLRWTCMRLVLYTHKVRGVWAAAGPVIRECKVVAPAFFSPKVSFS